MDQVPVKTLEQAYEDSGLSLKMAAEAMGWGRPGKWDSSRVNRFIGRSRSNGTTRKHVSYEEAVAAIKAWLLDPVDYGL